MGSPWPKFSFFSNFFGKNFQNPFSEPIKFEKIPNFCYNIYRENEKGEHENECLYVLLLQN